MAIGWRRVGIAMGPGLGLTRGLASVAAAVLLGVAAWSSATPAAGQILNETFEGVTVPALPEGWVATNAQGPDPLWSTTEQSQVDNAVDIDDPQAVSDKRLDSPPIRILSDGAVLDFDYRHEFSRGPNFNGPYYDGGVLEISIDGGPFQDILEAGGSFLQDGYNGTITGADNPLLGRAAFVGIDGGGNSHVKLPPVAGSTVVLRWRMGSSTEQSALSHNGWMIDDVRICDGYYCGTFQRPTRLSIGDFGNGVWEIAETVAASPYYFNNGGLPIALLGTIVKLDGPGGEDHYKINDGSADYGSIPPGAQNSCIATGDCYEVELNSLRLVPHWDAQLSEVLSNGGEVVWALHVGGSFADAPSSNLFYTDIETVFHRGISGGCGGGNYCPSGAALRKQMAVFLLKAKFGAAYVPPPAAGIFADVPASDSFAPWVEKLYSLGITGGCSTSPLKYCPDQTVLRRQMAVFLLKTLNGSAYLPPVCQGIFSDVACPSPYADWIEDLAARGISAGCGDGQFCPNNPNTRGQMAAFLVKTFALVLYGP